jgi:biotin-dependent carboxylase-like uncharacterized protein
MLVVVDPGLQATIQDAGRPDLARLGVPVAGAADRFGLAVANLVIGNASDAAAVEVTGGGFEARTEREVLVGLGGADLGAVVDGRSIDPGRAHRLAAGSIIRLDGAGGPGLRAYLALSGGVDAPVVLGGRSTYGLGRIGGLQGDGRTLSVGDELRAAGLGDSTARTERAATAEATATDPRQPLRVLPGPHADDAILASLAEQTWTVGPASDRMGIRLAGEPIELPEPALDASIPMVHGSIQVPAGGLPIILGPDHQTIGGYPVPAVLVRADLDRLGQLSPGGAVRFRLVTETEARAALDERRAALERVAAAIRTTDPWLDLAGDMAG